MTTDTEDKISIDEKWSNSGFCETFCWDFKVISIMKNDFGADMLTLEYLPSVSKDFHSESEHHL